MTNTPLSTFVGADANKSNNKPLENPYYTRPIANTFRVGADSTRTVVSHVIYTVDKFNPGPLKYRLYSLDGQTSKVVEKPEYDHLKATGKWFDSETDAQQASYKAKFSLNELGEVIEKKKAKATKVAKKEKEEKEEIAPESDEA